MLDTHELWLVDYLVPEANLPGIPGGGYAQFLRIRGEERITMASLATGLFQGCVDEYLGSVVEHGTFGRAIVQ